ncbi:MAG: zinc ribbon domain-containing protein [Nitrospirae bacterium]|nr:zinc ribbon domain-containing protein [Nitrospirota bacterium]
MGTESLTKCRDCNRQVSLSARICPQCGAPFPARAVYNGSGIEWKSRAAFYGYPLVHIAFGRDKKGKLRVAKGIIAIGQFAVGLITFAQFGIGVVFGFGQFIAGFTAISQFAIAVAFGLGQFATGHIAIGQFVAARYGLAQTGFAKYLWSTDRQDTEAVEFFLNLYQYIKTIFKIY